MMMTHDETVRELIIRSRLVELRELVQQTSDLYDLLRQHGTPPEFAVLYLKITWLRERIEEARNADLQRASVVKGAWGRVER